MLQKLIFLIIFVFACGFIVISDAIAQKSIRDSSITLLTIDVSYAGYVPVGDLAKRFGYTSILGGNVGLKHKSNFYFYTGGYFIFGDDVRENNILQGVSHNNSWFGTNGVSAVDAGWTDRNGQVIVPSLAERGFMIPFRIGKIFPKLSFKKTNSNTGVFLESGGQFIQHQISVSAPVNVPYLTGDYEKGYDRLTQGWGTVASIGYRYFGSSRYINFLFAFDFQYNLTRNRRFNFDMGKEDTQIHKDMFVGARFAWTLPLYKEAPDAYYYGSILK